MTNAKLTMRSFAPWAALLVALAACGEALETEQGSNIPLEKLVTLLAAGDFVELTPADTTRYLSDIVEVAPLPAMEYHWIFAGAAVDTGIRWARVEFDSEVPNAVDGWTLVQIQVALPVSDTTGRSIYESLTEALQVKIGKPDASEVEADRRITAWQLRERGALTVLEAELMHPETRAETRGVLLTAATMAGEEEG